MSRENEIDFAITYDQHYHWWTIACGNCGDHIVYKGFTVAFGFLFRHKKCQGHLS